MVLLLAIGPSGEVLHAALLSKGAKGVKVVIVTPDVSAFTLVGRANKATHTTIINNPAHNPNK